MKDLNRNSKIFSIPSKEKTVAFLQYLAVVISTFLAVYLTTNSYATSQNNYYHMYMDWELSIPLFPPMIIIYMTYVLIFLVVLFVFKTIEAIRALAISMMVTIGISGIIFFLFPGHLGYLRPTTVEGYQALYDFLYTIDHPHNLFPSLHIAFASICVLGLIHQTHNDVFHLSLKIWFLMVCASVMLVHQHHVFDILSGIALGYGVYKAVFIKLVESPNPIQLSLQTVTFKAFEKLKSLGDR